MNQATPLASEPSRADLRRAQVLEAAAKRFSSEGFQGASMASIAAEAEMSVGQIYRYFENKEAVIAALVEQSLAEWSRRIAAVRAKGDLVEELIEVARYHIEKVGHAEQAALTLEFLAEAARNPRIAEIVRVVDGAMRAHLKDALLRSGAADADSIEARIDMICMLVDAWALRTVKNPAVDKDQFLDTLRILFQSLLSCEQRS